jgi:hypothetical protein
MSHIDVVGTGRRVRKFVGFVGLALALATFWFRPRGDGYVECRLSARRHDR